ncbi:hypothetical protein N182_27935 [Sinorhizobium sp. GL2]|nr:hypothetical protein N182_27935 [Sinorhizobium sp. GL2]
MNEVERQIADELARSEIDGLMGQRIKALRLETGLTLKALSLKAQCSESLLSKIENGKVSPSISTLHRIAAALTTNIAELVAEEPAIVPVVMSADQRQLVRFGSEIDPLQSVLIERLTPLVSGSMLQADIYIVPAGCGSGGVLQHEGEEMGFVLEGEIEIMIADETYTAKKGDSFTFKSHLPHSFINNSDAPARIIWVNTPPTF